MRVVPVRGRKVMYRAEDDQAGFQVSGGARSDHPVITSTAQVDIYFRRTR